MSVSILLNIIAAQQIVEKKKNDDEKVNQKKKADQDDLESAKASIETFLNESAEQEDIKTTTL